MQAMPSPRPIQPMPSLVVALTLTRAEGLGEDPLHLGPVRAEPRLLADQRRVDVDDPAARACPGRPSAGRSSRRRASAPRRGGTACRCRRGRAAPRRASITAWVRTSASEWPARPALVLDLDPAEDQPPAGGEAVAVVADPDPDAHPAPLADHPSGSSVRWRRSKTAISLDPSRRMDSTACS